MFGNVASRAGRSTRAQARRGGLGAGLTVADKLNLLSRLATIAKLRQGFQKDVNAFATGFTGASDAADGIYTAGSSGFSRDSSAGCVKPIIAETRIAGGTPSSLFGGTAASFNDNSSGTTFTSSGLGALNALPVSGRTVTKLDLGSSKTITKIEAIQARCSSGSGISEGFYTSPDDSTWTAFGAAFDINSTPTNYTRTGSVSARYAAFVSGQNSWGAITWSVQDFNVYEALTSDSTVQFLQQTVDSTGFLFGVAHVHPVEAMTIGTTYVVEVYLAGAWVACSVFNGGLNEEGRTMVGFYKAGMVPSTTVDIRIRTVGKDHRTYRFGYDARNAP